MHINPVFDAPELGPRRIAAEAPTLGLRDAEDLPTALSFARFAAGDLSLVELEDYLAHRMAVFLGRAAAPAEEASP